jgi:class 3 adenylate cyclase
LVAINLAASHPERVDRLVLANAWARNLVADDIPWGFTPEFSESLIEQHRRLVGSGELFADAFVPSRRGDPLVREWFEAIESDISRAQAVELTRWSQEADVRDDLAKVTAPTLVLHNSDNRVVPHQHGEYLASHIPGAQLVLTPGTDHAFMVSDQRGPVLAELEHFLTGTRSAAGTERQFACVVFSDIVGSTPRAAREGDARWRTLLDDHDRVTRTIIEGHGGRVVKSTGDGVLATFDSPSRAVHAAAALVEQLEDSRTPVRAGIHAGEVEWRDDDVAGLAVHLAQRVCGCAGPGEVWVSRGYPDLVSGSDIAFVDRGEHVLKGLDEPMRVWAVRL